MGISFCKKMKTASVDYNWEDLLQKNKKPKNILRKLWKFNSTSKKNVAVTKENMTKKTSFKDGATAKIHSDKVLKKLDNVPEWVNRLSKPKNQKDLNLKKEPAKLLPSKVTSTNDRDTQRLSKIPDWVDRLSKPKNCPRDDQYYSYFLMGVIPRPALTYKASERIKKLAQPKKKVIRPTKVIGSNDLLSQPLPLTELSQRGPTIIQLLSQLQNIIDKNVPNENELEIAPGIFVPNIPPGSSNAQMYQIDLSRN